MPVSPVSSSLLLQKTWAHSPRSTILFLQRYFTPKLDNDNEPYFEFGHTYPITNPEKSTRTWGTSSGYFDGDTIVKDRQFGTGADIHMQSASANFAHANNWIQLTGRGFATTRFQQVHKPTGISFSENRIQGSLLNGLSMFNSLDEKVLPREMGAIKKLCSHPSLRLQVILCWPSVLMRRHLYISGSLRFLPEVALRL